MTIKTASKVNIELAASAILDDKLVAFPTETVYGIGANAYSEKALKKIFTAKGRPSNNPLIVHTSHFSKLVDIVDFEQLNSKQKNWLKKLSPLWPGPLTLVLPKNKKISPLASAGLNTIGVRIPDNKIALALIQASNTPLAAPSANKSNYVSPTRAQHVEECLGQEVEIILDGGLCDVGIESTILSLIYETPCVLRHGKITKEELEEILQTNIKNHKETNLNDVTKSPLSSPGLMRTHYSPKTPLFLKNQVAKENLSNNYGAILLSPKSKLQTELQKAKKVSYLSENGDLAIAGQNLYATLRALDKEGLDMIIIEDLQEELFGQALMDRITRASR